MNASDSRASPRTLSERAVSQALGIELLELLLVASELRAGCYDPLTHLFVFHLSEVERMAARLEIPWGEVVRKLAEKPEDPSERAVERVPEPGAE